MSYLTDKEFSILKKAAEGHGGDMGPAVDSVLGETNKFVEECMLQVALVDVRLQQLTITANYPSPAKSKLEEATRVAISAMIQAALADRMEEVFREMSSDFLRQVQDRTSTAMDVQNILDRVKAGEYPEDMDLSADVMEFFAEMKEQQNG